MVIERKDSLLRCLLVISIAAAVMFQLHSASAQAPPAGPQQPAPSPPAPAAADDLAQLQVSAAPDGVLVFDRRSGEVLIISRKDRAVERLGALRKDNAGKWELAADAAAGGADATRLGQAQTELSLLVTALNAFKIDAGRFPSTEEGLQGLVVQPPGAENWKGPYLKKLLLDPWGNPYVYRLPDKDKPYELRSFGPNRIDGGGDDVTAR